jgi:hypothetical protein
MKTTPLFVLLFSIAFSVYSAEPTPETNSSKTVITLQQLEEMFANMRAQTKWNLDGDMLWGYFFTDPDSKKLEPIATHLSDGGYRVVSIYPTDDKSTHFLHVERVEHHTPKTLHARNEELAALAAKFGIATYDGMDVGPAAPNPK